MMIPVIFQIRRGPFQIRSRPRLSRAVVHTADRGAAVAQRAYDEAVQPRARHNSQVFGGGGGSARQLCCCYCCQLGVHGMQRVAGDFISSVYFQDTNTLPPWFFTPAMNPSCV